MNRTQIFGALLVVLLAVWTFASGVLFTGNQQPVDVTPPLEESKFSYNLSFDTQVIKELGFIRFASATTYLEKQEIDLGIKKIEGVIGISNSFFRKPEGEEWVYFAELSFRKGFSAEKIVEEILALDYFSGESGTYESRKVVTVAIPKEPILLQNPELGIDKNYVFDMRTLSAWADIYTLPEDFIGVEGTIQLAGENVTALELMETTNETNQPQNFESTETLPISSIEEEIIFEGERELKTFIDKNQLIGELSSSGIDANLELVPLGTTLVVYFDENVPDQNTIETIKEVDGILSAELSEQNLLIGFEKEKIDSLAQELTLYLEQKNLFPVMDYPTELVYGTTQNVGASETLEAILSTKGFSSTIKQMATFDLNEFFIPELEETLPFEEASFSAGVNPGHSVWELIELELTITVKREKIVGVSGEELTN